MYIDSETLNHLLERIERIGEGDFLRAAELVRQVLAVGAPLPPEVEHALYCELNDFIISAHQQGDYNPEYKLEFETLTFEIYGHVAAYKVAAGWLVESDTAPQTYHPLSHFLKA